MNDKLANDLSVLQMQNQAFALRDYENSVCDSWLTGEVSDQFYADAMQATEDYVKFAISQGISRKDLPAV